MYYIRKYRNGWRVYNDNTGESRKLTDKEVITAKQAYPELADPRCVTYFHDWLEEIKNKP